MENQKVRDLSTATSPKATDFVMLITNLTNNVLEKCQLSELRTILTTNSISEDEGNALTTGSDDKLYVPDNTEDISIIENNLDALTGDVENVSNDLSVLSGRVDTIENQTTIIDKWQSGTEGYRIWSDGYCEQWGKVTSRDVTISFVKKFKDKNYRIDTQCCTNKTTNPAGDYSFPVTAYNFKTTAFTIWIYNTAFDSNMFVEWKASGYLANGEY